MARLIGVGFLLYSIVVDSKEIHRHYSYWSGLHTEIYDQCFTEMPEDFKSINPALVNYLCVFSALMEMPVTVISACRDDKDDNPTSRHAACVAIDFYLDDYDGMTGCEKHLAWLDTDEALQNYLHDTNMWEFTGKGRYVDQITPAWHIDFRLNGGSWSRINVKGEYQHYDAAVEWVKERCDA